MTPNMRKDWASTGPLPQSHCFGFKPFWVRHGFEPRFIAHRLQRRSVNRVSNPCRGAKLFNVLDCQPSGDGVRFPGVTRLGKRAHRDRGDITDVHQADARVCLFEIEGILLGSVVQALFGAHDATGQQRPAEVVYSLRRLYSATGTTLNRFSLKLSI